VTPWGWELLVFVIAGGFIAAFIDSAVGGGGLISVPVLLAAGLPPAVALGTNKLAGTMSSLTSTISFMRAGQVDSALVWRLFPLSLSGAVCGTLVLRSLPSGFLKPLVVVLLIGMTAYTLIRKDWGDHSARRRLTAGAVRTMGGAAFGLGFYDGFFGPGTGSFLIFGFLLLGCDFVKAAGNAKVLNFGSNAASLAAFLATGSVQFGAGIPMGLAMIAGSLLGSRTAIRKGTTYVRPLFIAVSIVLIGKQLWDLLA
jgi:hypothetical protein